MVEGTGRRTEIAQVTVDEEALQNNQIKMNEKGKVLIASGNHDKLQPGRKYCVQLAHSILVKIVDPETCIAKANAFEIGEIWVEHTKHMPLGYWNKEELTKQVFFASLNEKYYMRTGDLGFVGKQGMQ